MGDLLIEGGKPLRGSVRIQGSKNAALPFMAAALLCHGVTVLRGCPRISDVFCMERILQSLGVTSRWEDHDLYLDCTHIENDRIEMEYAGAMRSSILLLGPLLIRKGRCRIGIPGGCTIGKRPVDMHMDLLQRMGAEIEMQQNWICAHTAGLNGAEIHLKSRSVGATEQGILSAVCADGRTILNNCAREPEIVWLCRLLRAMGAEIGGEGSDRIEIFGSRHLQGAVYEIPPDRIVAGTYLCACAATRGKIELERAPLDELGSFLEVYKKMGGQYKQKSGKLLADSVGVTYPISFLRTDVYPGFPTDLQSPLMAVLSTIPAQSTICETIFENRFQAAEEFQKMGALIQVKEKEAVIWGKKTLSGCEVYAKELRGGAALVVAALAAHGTTKLNGYSYIQRGYEDICKDITALGGRIRESTGTGVYG